MNRKVQIVRFWLLATFAVAWAILYHDPTLAIVPVAFFTGQASCFCCTGCTNCTGDQPNQFQLDIAGVTNGVCNNCTVYNGTWVLTRTTTLCQGTDVPSTFCYWAYSQSSNYCPNLGAAGTICLATYFDSTNLWAALYTGTSSGVIFSWNEAGTYDCDSFSAYNVPNMTNGGVGCAGAATAAITAL